MSDVGKIMSDIIQTTSDLFLPLASVWKTETYKNIAMFVQILVAQGVAWFPA